MSDGWRVWQAGKVLGPWSSAELQAASAAGRLRTDALVRGPDDAEWRPLADSGLSPGPARRAAARRTSKAGAVFALVVTALFVAVVALAATLVYGEALIPLTIRHRWLWTAVAAGGSASLVLTALTWWLTTRRLAARSPETGGIVRIVLGLVLTGAAVLVGVVWMGARDASDAAAVSATMSGYRFFYSPADKSLRIVGFIGPRFDTRLAAELARHDVETIEIVSPGGLIWEAVHAARLIERRNLTTVARSQCDSACLIVLMAGQRRQASYDIDLGFHAPAPTIPGHDPEALRQGAMADSYLASRGVPKAILSEARRRGPSQIYYLPAVELARAGILTGLLKDADPIEVRDADLLLSLDEAD